MPTYNRRRFIPAALDCWIKQDYENKELVIVDDGDDGTEELIPNDSRIRYFKVPRMLTGQKRNACNDRANGDIICHFDTDDWSATDRISFQLKLLLDSKADITGFSRLYFWDTLTNQAKRYESQQVGYIVGTSFMYHKSFWKQRHFRDKQIASDNDFISGMHRRTFASADDRRMVARIHADHTSGKQNIKTVVDKSLIPSAFWENEKLIGRAR